MDTIRINENYAKILLEVIAAWNRADPGAVASYYADDLEYRDPSVPAGINRKEDFIKYLSLMFRIWPQQEWVPGELFQHTDGKSITGMYRFRIANGKTEIKGLGIDYIEFEGNTIKKNYVYLNADKWNSWLKKELGV
jgi:hypothetical protein